MRPTRISVLLLCAAATAMLAYLLVDSVYADLPPLPRYAPVTLALLAIVELGMARVVHDRIQGRARRGARHLHPLQVARAVALAKASSPTGALLLGAYAGVFGWLLPKGAAHQRDDLLVSGVSAVAALALVVAALLLERACRAPQDRDSDGPADGRGHGARA